MLAFLQPDLVPDACNTQSLPVEPKNRGGAEYAGRMHSFTISLACAMLAAAALPYQGPEQPGQEARRGGALSVTGVPESAPFTLMANATDRVLRLNLDIESGWHMYSADVGGGAPVSVVIGGAFENDGELVFPTDPESHITGDAEICIPIRRARDAESVTGALTATVELQVCDALECLEPMTIELRGEARALSTLLVVGEVDEHAARIQEWLTARGFQVTATTYEKVDAQAAEASDIVIADSKSFGAARSILTHLESFPRTETPVLAVGFAGTELVEAHGLAMTSGYI